MLRNLRRIVGYTALLAPFLLLGFIARDWYFGLMIIAYGVFAALLTLD